MKFFLIFFLTCSAQATTVLFLGDSLTAGYGVKPNKSYPEVLKYLIKKRKQKDIKVFNGSVSGSTTASGLKRLRFFLKAKPNILVLALGANDGLRGIQLASSQKHLQEIIKLAQKHQIKIVLAGMQLPPNYGEPYRLQFKKMYQKLYQNYQITLIPFLLEGVGGEKHLNQADGIHPNEQGHQIMAETVFKILEPLL